MITSTSSFSGVSYRVHRTITGSGTPATVVKVIDFSALVSNGQMTLIDPYVWPGTGYTYWIEVVASDGTVSAPSPISTVNVGVFGAGLAGGMATFPAPVATTITGTKTITLFGQQGPGSDVTWTWNLTTGPVFVYHISYELNPSTSLVPGVGGMPIIRAEVPIQFTPPNAPGAPTFTMGVPQGQTARFCVWVYADPDLTKPLPQEKVCTDTRVP
jgi:hypothetical protein